MLVKPLDQPIVLEQLRSLLKRIPPSSPLQPRIEKELATRKAGFSGETSVDYYLPFIDEAAAVLRDIRLDTPHAHAQIDLLIVTPTFALIVELKNIAGVFQFDSIFQQCIRTFNDKEERFSNPLLQVERQKTQFVKWLKENRFPLLPVETLVLFTNGNTLIKGPDVSSARIGHLEILPAVMTKLESHYSKRVLRREIQQQLANALLQAHTPQRFNILSYFQLSETDVMKGVFCPTCSKGSMRRVHGSWKCHHCEAISKVAHVQALYEYQLLFGDTLTRKELQRFLGLSSRHTALRLIQNMKLRPADGRAKSQLYALPDLDFTRK
ncbi:nuclease-related domain-containing protein [Aureibacillus halotolerans]|uniref:Nuclease-like protein n=1 Tax=Aureibacillus halotolerans TaxID=1508390 RepID=A0A4R6TXQ3_9BACI|nr:nuclease-related domain-containing protein [Aureibacillus halotolerans]TDQ38668.1 nuclease-like protein [Aureibacillus halotolerans]